MHLSKATNRRIPLMVKLNHGNNSPLVRLMLFLFDNSLLAMLKINLLLFLHHVTLWECWERGNKMGELIERRQDMALCDRKLTYHIEITYRNSRIYCRKTCNRKFEI